MGQRPLNTEQMQNIARLPVSGVPANTLLDTTLPALDKGHNFPCRLYASFPADAKINIEASQVKAADGTGKSPGKVESAIPSTVQTTINFQTGAVVGATINGTIPSSTAGEFRRAVFTLLGNSTIQMNFTNPAGSVGALESPLGYFVATGKSLGWVDLESTGTTTYKTAGSATSVIEDEVSGVTRIVNVVGGGGSSSATIDNYDNILIDVLGNVVADSTGNIVVKG